jgi:hypothetical protein
LPEPNLGFKQLGHDSTRLSSATNIPVCLRQIPTLPKSTLQLFERVKLGNVICVFSDLAETELLIAPNNVREYFMNLPKQHIERVIVTDEILTPASKYVAEKVVGQTSFDDCVHIATATIYKTDILVSWNFKHIVNVYRIRGYNSINIRSNYQPLEIRSPK